LLAAGFSGVSTIRRHSFVSLRFDTPISGQAAYRARLYSIERTESDPFWPTFRHEYRASFENEFVTLSADCIAFSGDASLVWPAAYIRGAAPGVIDPHGCAVSEALAWRLWGSIDVVGMTVKVDGAACTVRGVFEGDAEMALISFQDEDMSPSWSAAELSGGPIHAVRSDVEGYAISSGLGRPNYILMDGPRFIAGAMAVFPILLPAGYGLMLLIGLIRKRHPAAGTPIVFVCLLALAVLLPSLLAALPAWLIPTRWSDFSFWASISRQVTGGLQEFLSAPPGLADVQLRVALLRQFAITFMATCCSIVLCFRWHMRGEKNG